MELSPQGVRNAQFKSARKGLDPDEVRAFLSSVADELERAQNQSTAMEARARAAVARMQELSEATPSPEAAPAASADEAETISRTLLLAQRTADRALADAEAESARRIAAADADAARTLESSQQTAARMLEQAKAEAHEVGKEERLALDAEVSALMARRDFLESDVEHLEQFLVAQRSRLRDAASALVDLTERIPGGLGDVRRPLLSASDDAAGGTSDPEEDTDPYGVTSVGDSADADGGDDASTAADDDHHDPALEDTEPMPAPSPRERGEPDFGDRGGDGGAHEASNVTTELAGLVAETDEEAPGAPEPTPAGDADDEGFRLRFDDRG
jgi:cell division initiation protein